MCKCGVNKLCLVPIDARDSHIKLAYWTLKGIDACIADKVNALNRAGKLTRCSCCGHGKVSGSIMLHDNTVISTGMAKV